MILKYALVHALSSTEITDFFLLVNSIFTFHVMLNARYFQLINFSIAKAVQNFMRLVQNAVRTLVNSRV